MDRHSQTSGTIRSSDGRARDDEFARYLVGTERLTMAALERAERLANDEDRPFSVVLIALGLIADRELAEAYAAFLDIRVLTGAELPSEIVTSVALNPWFLKEYRLLPVADLPEKFVIVMADPLDHASIEGMSFATRKPVERCVASAADIDAAYEHLYEEATSGGKNDFDPASLEGAGEHDIDRLRDGASEAPVIRFVNQVIARGVEERASDIHFEATENELIFRYRIDGVLRDADALPATLRAAIISRLKIMARLDIAERRLSQDGRMTIAVRGRDIDFRISTVPTIHGESVVLRILDRDGLTLELGALGFTGSALDNWIKALKRPHGILLVTGPTGSGKTTTLYASLMAIADRTKKILTIEDPIEYQLPFINQTQIKPGIGVTFASALRSFLRQDPDIMMIGEIRDLETARISIQAALTGHLILSTLHTNDAASALTRLLDMGVEDYLMSSTINAIAAQRLVRLLCLECREMENPLPEMRRRFPGLQGRFHRATGCPKCQGSGYFGRTALVEVLIVSDEIRRIILRRGDTGEMRNQAVAEGMRRLEQQGLDLAAAGLTSLDEVFRVCAGE